MSNYLMSRFLISITFSIILPPNLRSKTSTNYQIYPGTMDKNKNSKVRTIKILLDSSAGASIELKDAFY